MRRRTTIRRVDPWGVLKLSLVFYTCFLIVVMVALVLFWGVITRLGVIEGLVEFLAELRLELVVNGSNIGRAVLLVGLLNVVLWSGVNVFLAFLYNLVADVLGGLKLTLSEEE